MKFSLKYIGMAAGILLLGSGSARGETLQDAVKNMLQTNPEIKAVSYNRLARDQQVIQAKGGYFPTLDVSHSSGIDYQNGYNIGYTEISRPKSTVLSLRQNLYQFGATDSEVSRLEATVRSQAYLLQGTSENLALKASSVYLNVLSNLELYEGGNRPFAGRPGQALVRECRHSRINGGSGAVGCEKLSHRQVC